LPFTKRKDRNKLTMHVNVKCQK